MPITPEFYDYEFDYLQTHKDLQESILRDITRRILKTDFVTDTAAWQAEKLQQSGMVFNDVLAEVGKRTSKMPKEVKKIFSDAETEVFNYDDELLIESGYNPETIKHISPTMRRTITAALKKTCTDAVNLTKTTANTSQSLYISACDLAHMQISSGAFTYQQAIANAIKHAAKQGVTVTYPSGHVSSLDVAVRRSVLTGVNQTAGKLQDMRSDEAGVDLMEITAHAGAREEHAVWQGKIVSKSGRKGYLSLADIGYGSVTGFQGANCRHNWHMFFEGISKRAYTDEMLQEMNNRTVTYNGETMKEYDAIQMQRRYERGIRQSKQELVMLDEAIKNAPDDATRQQLQQEFEAAAVKLKSREARLADFAKQTGLRRDRYREQVFAVKTEKTIAGYGKSVSGKAVYQAQRHYDVFRATIPEANVPKTLAEYYQVKYNNKELYKIWSLDYRRRVRLQRDAALRLPNSDVAYADEQKFIGYLFNPANPKGYAKGKAFASRLGYSATNYTELQNLIMKNASVYPARFIRNNGHGDLYEQKIVLYGLKGKPANVVVGWIVDGAETRMTSAYIKEV